MEVWILHLQVPALIIAMGVRSFTGPGVGFGELRTSCWAEFTQLCDSHPGGCLQELEWAVALELAGDLEVWMCE